MHIRNLAQQFEISYVIKDKWHLPVHKHTHYELQFIIRGMGQHIVNDQTYNYKPGDVFILPPQDNHFFIFNERTAICVVKFHQGFFEEYLHQEGFKQLFGLFSSHNLKAYLSGNNRQQVTSLMKLIITENRKGTNYHQFIIKNALVLVLALISKDTEANPVQSSDNRIQSILNFIDQHIKEKHQLSVQHISEQFNISQSYFNQYFSKATGSSYKKYVQQYALNLIAHQLIHSNKTLMELADEFGFTDDSHLSNSFKAHFGKSPTAFKKTHRE